MPQYMFKKLSSLAKVFPDKIYGPAYQKEVVCRGESLSFQLAVRGMESTDSRLYISCNSDFEAQLFRVGYVPSELAAYPTSKCRKYITKKSGLFPDPLFPLDRGALTVTASEWTSIFVTVKIPNACDSGDKTLLLTVADKERIVDRTSFAFTVLDATLPPQKTEFAQWFHADCIADVHGVKVFSKKHWSLMEKYMRLAGENGITSILTPVFTPPLDTLVGGERTTVQLVSIFKNDTQYDFDFSLLQRFTALARTAGISKIEIAHLFTQWGAGFAPKIIVRENGKTKKLFGWKTKAMSAEYKNFLSQFIPALILELEKEGYDKSRVMFHISDEPSQEHLAAYQNAVEFVKPLVGEYPIYDALSNIEFYKNRLVERPVVSISHIHHFIDAEVSHLWGYYCCAQGEDVSNRFMSMPAARNRIIGLQLYKFGIEGFLHWGYNFYSTQYSKMQIDPYKITDAGKAFPSGDAFSVYPYKDGVIPSTRLIVFKQALDDIRLLSLIEEKIGKTETVALIDKLCGTELTFKEYPTNGQVFFRLRRAAAKILKSN